MNSTKSTQHELKGNTVYTCLIAAVAAVGGFLFVFDWAVISGTVTYIERYFSLTSVEPGTPVSSALFVRHAERSIWP